MADKKAKKVSLSIDAGAPQQVERVAPKEDPGIWGEAVVYQTKEGKRWAVPRGDMSDEEWNKIVNRAKQDAEYAYTTDAEGDKRPEISVEAGAPEKIQRAEPLTPQQTAVSLAAPRDYNPERKLVTVPENSVTGPSPDFERAPAPKTDRYGKPLTGPAPIGAQPSGRPSSVLSQIAKLITGAAPDAGVGAPAGGVPPMVGEAGATLPTAGTPAPPDAGILQGPGPNVPVISQSPAAGWMGLSPGTPGYVPPGVNYEAPPEGPRPDKNALTPEQTAAMMNQAQTDEAAKADAGRAALEAAGRVPGGMYVDPKYAKATEAATKEALATGHVVGKVLDEQMAAAQQREEDYANARATTQAVNDSYTAQIQENQQNMMRSVSRAQTLMQAAIDEASRVSAVSTDPGRFWNNASEGQKAASILAAFAFGFTGQGMDWLKRIDSLVEQDVRLQQADRESRVSGLMQKAKGYERAGDVAMRLGASQGEALQAERAQRWAELGQFAKQLELGAATQQTKVAAAMIGSEIAAKQQQIAMQAEQMAQTNAYHQGVLALQSWKVKVGAMMGAGGGKQQKLPAQVQKAHDQIVGALDALTQFEAEQKKKGTLDDLVDSAALTARMIPFVGQYIGRQTAGRDLAAKDVLGSAAGFVGKGYADQIRNAMKGAGVGSARVPMLEQIRVIKMELAARAKAYERSGVELNQMNAAALGSTGPDDTEEAGTPLE